MEKNLLRILAANLPENSIRPLIAAAERLESFFQEKPHGFDDQYSNQNFKKQIEEKRRGPSTDIDMYTEQQRERD